MDRSPFMLMDQRNTSLFYKTTSERQTFRAPLMKRQDIEVHGFDIVDVIRSLSRGE